MKKNLKTLLVQASVAAGLTFGVISCNNRNTQLEDQNANQIISLDLSECLNTTTNDRLQFTIDPADIIELQGSEEFYPDSCYLITEICDDIMVAANSKVAKAFRLPTGEIVASVSHCGKNEDEYTHIGDATVTGAEESNLIILSGDWTTDSAEIRCYDHNNMTRFSHTKLYGDIRNESDSTFIATNALGFSGGQRKLYRLNSNFEKIDSVNLPEFMEPQEAYFYLECPIKYDGKELYVFLNDTIFTLSNTYDATPIIALNYGDKRIPYDVEAKRYKTRAERLKALEPYINMMYIDKFGNYLITLYETDGNTYKTILDTESGNVVWNKKLEADDAYGVELQINGTTVKSFPYTIWNDNILFGLTGKEMGEIYGKPTKNSGIVLLPLSTFKNKFSGI